MSARDSLFTRRGLGLCASVVVALVLTGCSEKPQELGASRKTDESPWGTAPTAFAGPGWQGGDKTAWEAQMRTRSQGQNEYSRSAAQP